MVKVYGGLCFFKYYKMKLKGLLLLLMIGYGASLHIVELIDKVALYPLYLNFPLLFGFISYDIFWGTYWSFAFLLMLTLLGGNTTIKNKTEIHNHPAEKKFKTYEGKNITKDTPVIILDDNPVSVAGYVEEYPENWKAICDALDKEKKNKNEKNNN